MKKCLLLLCFCLSLNSSCLAIDFYPYQVNPSQNINGKITKNGNTDYITMPAKDGFFRSIIAPTSASVFPILLASDPYIIPIDGKKYIMVKDKTTQNWSEQDLLGINDPKDNVFKSLKELESDGNPDKLTGAEIKKAGIRLVLLDKDGSLLVNEREKDYNLDKIDYIDMKNIKKTANSEVTGIFGHFNVYIKTKTTKPKMVVGYITFDTENNLEILFK